MAITYLGERKLDAANSRIIYNVLAEGDMLYCSIDTNILQSLCGEDGGAMEAFNSCRMFILECTYRKYVHSPTILGDHITIVRQAELIPA